MNNILDTKLSIEIATTENIENVISTALSVDVKKMDADVSALQTDFSYLSGNVSTLQGLSSVIKTKSSSQLLDPSTQISGIYRNVLGQDIPSNNHGHGLWILSGDAVKKNATYYAYKKKSFPGSNSTLRLMYSKDRIGMDGGFDKVDLQLTATSNAISIHTEADTNFIFVNVCTTEGNPTVQFTSSDIATYFGCEQVESEDQLKFDQFYNNILSIGKNSLDDVYQQMPTDISTIFDTLSVLPQNVYSKRASRNLMTNEMDNYTIGTVLRGKTSDRKYVSNNQGFGVWFIPIENNKRYVVRTKEQFYGKYGELYVQLKTLSSIPAVDGYADIYEEKEFGKNGEISAEITNTEGNYLYVCLRDESSKSTIDTEKAKFLIGVQQQDFGGFDEQFGSTGTILDIRSENFPEGTDLSNLSKLSKLDDINFNVGHSYKGKNIVWFGTSIPAGAVNGKSYPQLVADKLQAVMHNESGGASMCRANVRTGDALSANQSNFYYSLTQTIEEKQRYVSEWSTLSSKMTGINESVTNQILNNSDYIYNMSFERKLMPYLTGNYDIDLFVLDHGHNDFKYLLSDNATTDIDIQPTRKSITDGVLAEDTYMISNDYENLEKYVGSLSAIPSSEKDEFVCSLNRNCYKGAMNFICMTILHHNPRAKIAFIENIDDTYSSNYITSTTNRSNVRKLLDAQNELSREWAFPLLKTKNALGLSLKRIPGTRALWDSTKTQDLTLRQVYMPDDTHPSSDTTGETVETIARVLANQLYFDAFVGNTLL